MLLRYKVASSDATLMLRQLKLLKWLGPWTPPSRRPEHIEQETISIAAGSRSFDGLLYRAPGRDPIGAYLLLPGLHPNGPSDERMDRFARILADAGYLVLAPCLEDFMRQEVTQRSIDDTERAFEALLARPGLPRGCKPRVFSISFASLLALRLATSPRHAEKVDRLVIFGGYSRWPTALRFALTGEIDGRVVGDYDPLNLPVAFINLIDAIAGAPSDSEAQATLKSAWVEFCRGTWQSPEMMEAEGYIPFAEEQSKALPEDLRELFLIGCRALPGGAPLCLDAIDRMDESLLAMVDPLRDLEALRCSIHIAHGADDHVIPPAEAEALAAALPAHVERHVYLTGLYGHTASDLPSLRELFREAWTLLLMVDAI